MMPQVEITYSFEDPFDRPEVKSYNSFESFLEEYPRFASYFEEEAVRHSNQSITIQNENVPFEEKVIVEWS